MFPGVVGFIYIYIYIYILRVGKNWESLLLLRRALAQTGPSVASVGSVESVESGVPCWAMPQTRTPNFNKLFIASAFRRSFCKRGTPTKKGAELKPKRAKPTKDAELKHLALKIRKPCCKRGCCSNLAAAALDEIAEWRVNWKVIPRREKRVALLNHIKACQGVRPETSVETEEVGFTTIGDKKQVVLREDTDNKRTSYGFLGRNLCKSAFERLTGVRTSRAVTMHLKGSRTWLEQAPQRLCSSRSQMANAIWMVVHDIHHQSPYAGKAEAETWYMPFHQKVCLWRLIVALHKSCRADPKKPPLFSMEPSYSFFRTVLRESQFKSVVFHRMVDIGRCPKCEYFRWKCSSVAVGLRSIWQDAMSQHHLLHIRQKQIYAADRAKAAADFPNSELYLVSQHGPHNPCGVHGPCSPHGACSTAQSVHVVRTVRVVHNHQSMWSTCSPGVHGCSPQQPVHAQAMDCGSGKEFVFPHLASADREGPNKAVDQTSTHPMKVCNGLVHGDTRSHVILSPAVVGATANHTCECIAIFINTAYLEHKDLPPTVTVQFDGASVNKNILVLALLGLYVMEGVFRQARARCELENHAHDVYDAFHAIHASRVRTSTYFHHDELIDLIKCAHVQKHNSGELRPIVGHKVMVRNLWQVRDLWEWMAPGYTDPRTRDHALAHATFSSFGSFQGYRDFMVALEASSTDENPKVGLWTKAYMSSPGYEFLGTLLTRESFRSVTEGGMPVLQNRELSDQKTRHETDTLKALQKAARGPFAKQFSQARLCDAMAQCLRNWEHFASSAGALSVEEQWLPHQLMADMVRRGVRGCANVPRSVMSVMSSQQDSAERAESAALADLDPSRQPPPLKRKFHAAFNEFKFSRGDRTVEAQPVPSQGLTDEQFRKQVVKIGSCVITRAASHSQWAKASKKLANLDFWLWQVKRVYPPGSHVVGFSKPCATFSYEAHLYHPVRDVKGPWTQTWDVVGPQFLRTEAEKRERNAKQVRNRFQRMKKQRREKLKRGEKRVRGEGPQALPVRSYLRPDNVVGGGFVRTARGCIPAYVQRYWLRHR